MAEKELKLQIDTRLLSDVAKKWADKNAASLPNLVANAINEAAFRTRPLAATASEQNQKQERSAVKGLMSRQADVLNEAPQAVGATVQFTVPDQLLPFLVEAPELHESSVLLSARDAAKRLKLAPGTVLSWIASNKLVGFRSSGRNYLVPSEQIVGERRVVPNLEDVLPLFSSHEEAWEFLTRRLFFSENSSELRPIDLLKEGLVSKVLEHAHSYTEGYEP